MRSAPLSDIDTRVFDHQAMKVRYRKRGLPKRLKSIPGIRGLRAACEIHFEEGQPVAKVAVFKDRASMRHFYHKILPQYDDGGAGDRLCKRCAAVVCGLFTDVETFDKKTGQWIPSVNVDRRYFCLVLLCEGDLTAEILSHEAVHVVFAWDRRTNGVSCFTDKHNHEENLCYPAGIFVDQVLSFIKSENLREV